MISKFSSIVLLSLMAFAPAWVSADPLTYNLHNNGSGWPEHIREAIDDAMAEAVELYNRHGYFDKHVTANYNPGVPTAHANYDGWIEFGGEAFMTTRVALHEISHTLGVGTHWNWNDNRDGNTWTGEHAVRQLRHFDGDGAILNADGMHFWPYGLNQDNEDGEINRIRHIKMVAAMRRDMDIVGQINGLPADWHRFHLGGSSRIGAQHDTDGDGFTNLEEYLADTDPRDPLSYPDAPGLAHRWLFNEHAGTAGFDRLRPDFSPPADRESSAVLAADTGRDALFIKGNDLSSPGALFGGPAARGERKAEDSTGSVGTVSSAARVELGNVLGGAEPFTVAFWFNRYPLDPAGDSGDPRHILSATEGESGTWHLHAGSIDPDTDTYSLGFDHHSLEGADGFDPVFASDLRPDRWYHLMLTRDEENEITVFLDGEPVFSETVEPASVGFLGSAGDGSGNGDDIIAYWRFEEGSDGSAVPVEANAILDGSGNENHLRTWGTGTAPSYVTDVPFESVPETGEPNTYALDFADGQRDVYSDGKMINGYPFEEITVEASFLANVTDAWQVIVGKDGNPIGGQPPFSLKVRSDGFLEAAIADGGGTRRQLLSQEPVEAGVWYDTVATVTGSEMTLWLKESGDDAYALENTMQVDGIFSPSDGLWTVGRGQWNGGNADFFNGLIDEVRISSVAKGGNRVLLGQDAGQEAGAAFPGRFDDVRIYRGAMRERDVTHLTGTREGTDYETWADENLDEGQATAPDARSGGDNVPNLLRYSLGLPAGEPLGARVGAPEVGDGRLTLTFERDPAAIGATVRAEFSDDLIHWVPGHERVVFDEENGTETVTAEAPDFLDANSRQFVRIRAAFD